MRSCLILTGKNKIQCHYICTHILSDTCVDTLPTLALTPDHSRRWTDEIRRYNSNLNHCSGHTAGYAARLQWLVHRLRGDTFIQGGSALCQAFDHCSYFCFDHIISPTYQSSDNASKLSASEQVVDRIQIPTTWHKMSCLRLKSKQAPKFC